ncbi:hypothetical protein [Bradyrhizobium sp. UFLA03-84]|uniref:hypothetical protein n=1 Tax=Bradyrhizobium sp. UFLA03-84 TaxID=418599 RepID=UPI0018E91E9D|nr:hypothetical protein [Bradyrhizobium sp. UFLA03-84]
MQDAKTKKCTITETKPTSTETTVVSGDTAKLDAMRVMNKTLKPLYDTLSDGQKKNCGSVVLESNGHDVIDRTLGKNRYAPREVAF